MKLAPDTKFGRISARLLAVSVAVFVVAIIVSIAFDQGGSEASDSNDVIRMLLGFSFLLSGLGALITAAIAVFRDRERALLTFLALAFGMFAAVFVLGDIVLQS